MAEVGPATTACWGSTAAPALQKLWTSPMVLMQATLCFSPSLQHTQGVSCGWQSPDCFVTQPVRHRCLWHRCTYHLSPSTRAAGTQLGSSDAWLFSLQFFLVSFFFTIANLFMQARWSVSRNFAWLRNVQHVVCFFFFSNSWLSSLTTGSSFLPKNPLVAFNGEGSCCCPQVTTCTWEWVMLPGALNTHSNNSFTSPRGAGLVLDLFLSFFLAFLLIF